MSVAANWAWGMARFGDESSAVLRWGDRAVSVAQINQTLGASYPVDLGRLIANGVTAEVQHLVRTGNLMESAGLDVAGLVMEIPLARPDRIVGIGLNFGQHADDLGEPVPVRPATFLKPHNAIAASGSRISLPVQVRDVTAEGEVALVLSRPTKDVSAAGGQSVVWGALTVLDLTAEDVLRVNPRFLTRAKGYDGFFVMSDWLVPWGAAEYLQSRNICTLVNGTVQSEDVTDHMTYGYGEILELVSEGTTLGALAIISTGTPGAAHIAAGDQVAAEVQGLFPVEFTAAE